MSVTNLSLVCNLLLMIKSKHNLFLESTKYNPKPNMVWSRKLYHPTVGESSQQKILSPPPSFLLYQRYYIYI
jgi:hypothetical protein